MNEYEEAQIALLLREHGTNGIMQMLFDVLRDEYTDEAIARLLHGSVDDALQSAREAERTA